MSVVGGLCRRVLVLAVSVGLVASLLVALPAAASWTPPPPGSASAVSPNVVVAGDRYGELFGASASVVGDERAGNAPRPDDGVVFDGPGLVPAKQSIGSSSTPGVIGPAQDPVEIPARRTATSTVFDNGNGTVTVRQFTSPQFFRAVDGSWARIDNRVIADPARKGWLKNAGGEWNVAFGPVSADGSGGVEIAKGAVSLRMTPDFVAAGRVVAPEVSADKVGVVIYRNVADGVDLTYRVTAIGVKEDVVLRAKPAQSSFSFTVDGAEFAADDRGELRPVGDAQHSMKIPAAVVTDRAGAEVDRAAAKPTITGRAKAAAVTPAVPAAPATTPPAAAAQASTITVGVDEAWLAALDASAFPIAIDPSFTDGGDTWQNFWWNGVSTYGNNALGAWEWNYAGNQWTGSNKYWRGFIRFPQYQTIPGQIVTSAKVWAGEREANAAAAVSLYGVDGAAASWTFNLPSGSPIGTQIINSTGTNVFYDVTALVQGWVNTSPVPSKAFVFVGAQTSGVYTKKALESWMDVTYTSNTPPPAATANPNPEHNAVTVLDAPTFAVDAVTDADVGDTVSYRFQVDNDADFLSPAITSGWLTSPSYTLAAGALDSATTWFWRVATQDSHGATTTPTAGFALRTTAFGYNGFSGYFKGLNTLGGNYVFSETDARVASVGPGLALTRTFNTQNPEVGVFGQGWSTPYFMAWNASGANIIVTYPDGRKETHTPNGSGGWTPPAGYVAQLAGSAATGFTLEQGDNSIYTFGSGTTTGRLTQIKDAYGHQLNIDYTNFAATPQRIGITDVASARSLTVKVTGTLASFKITSVEAPDPTGGSTPLVWTYTYDTANPNRLVSACDARGATGYCRTYGWDGAGRLWKVFDRKTQLDMQFGYSTFGNRVTSITDALGAMTTFSYARQATAPFNNQVEMTDARTNKWRHDYSPQGLLVGEFVPGITQGWEYLYDTTTKMRTESRDPLYVAANRTAGHYSTIDYNTDLRAQLETSGVGTKTYKVRDLAGNVAKVCDGRSVDANNDKVPDAPDTYCTIFDYGATLAEQSKGLLWSKNEFGLPAETFTYTGVNDTYASGSTTTYAPAGLVKTHGEPSGKVTTYEYTVAGDLARVTDNTGPGTGVATTRYEAESATHNYSFSNASTTPAYSGSGFVQYGNWNGSSVQWTVNAATAGAYSLKIRATTYQGPTARDIKINGATAATVTVPSTAWLNWVDVTTTVNLNAGSNTIEIVYNASTGSADAYFDFIEITGAGGVGQDVRFEYDAIGRLTTQRACSSDAYACPTATTGGVPVTFTYDAVNNKLTETQPAIINPVSSIAHRQQTSWTYDANSNVTQTAVADLVGGDVTRTSTAGYDTVDRMKETTDAEGNVTQRRFDVVGNVDYVRDGEGRWVKTVYDVRNRATAVQMLGVVADPTVAAVQRTLSTTEYDAAGRKTATIDARNQRVEFTYDGGDRQTQTIVKNYRDDLTTSTPRDVLISKIDAFDGADRPLSISEGGVPGGTVLRATTFTYDSQGRKTTSSIASVGMTETLTYDTASRVTKTVTNRSGVATGGVATAETRTVYDTASRVVSSTVENGATDLTTTNTFDSRGVAKTTQTPGGSTTTFTSDQFGRIVSATAPAVNAETGGGAPAAVSPSTMSGFNTFGDPTHGKDERNFVTSTAYDKLGRAVTITYPSYTPPTGGAAIVASESFVYDKVGNQTRHTDRRGNVTDYTFDLYNKVTVQLDPAVGAAARGQTSFSYDENANVVSTTNPEGAVTNFSYDSMNRVRKQDQVVRTLTPNGTSVPGGTYTTTVEHDDLGRVVKTTSPAGVITSTTYDALGEATVVKNTNNTVVAQASYDVLGNTVITADGLGRETRTVFDQAGRATTVGRFANSAASTAVTSTSASYDANSNITAVVDANGHTTSAAFDAIGRLTSVTSPVSASKTITTSYGYDAAGNLTRVRDGRALSPSPFYADSFDGSNGSAWSALRWATSASTGGTTPGVVDIQATAGRLRVANVASSWARATDNATAPRNAGSTHQDAELTATVKASSIGSGLTTRFTMRGSGIWNGNTNQTGGYVLVINQAGDTIAVKKNVSSGAEAALSTGGGAVTCSCTSTTATYKVKFQTVGTTVRAKIWDSTGAEPGSWTVSGTDSSLASGTVAVAVSTDATNATARTVTIDNLAVTPATSAATLTAYDTVTTYNAWGLPETVVEAAAGAQTNANQRTFTREYNAGGLPTKDISPDGTTGGIVVTAAFDELGRLSSESAVGLTKTYGYDKASRPTSISLPTGTQSFVFDDRSLMVGATGTAGNMVAKFNGDNQLTWRTDPSGLANYRYNNLGLADQVGDASTGTTLNIGYLVDGRVDRIDYGVPGSATPYRTYTYDSIGRKQGDVVTVGATTKYDASYTYDANNNVVTENVKNLYGASSTDELYTYQYDWSNRLTQDQRKIGTGTPTTTNNTFDDAGNRTSSGSKTWTYDQRGRITSNNVDGNYTWDPRGTLDKTVNASNLAVDYTFDAMGRMAGYNGNGSNVTYTYDALDRIGDRTNTTTAQTTNFTYSGTSTKPAATTLAGSTKSYSRDQNGNVIGVKNGATARLAATNQHTDLRFLFDTTGAVTDTKTYDPTGNVLASTGTTGSDLGYQSEYTDPTSNQVWMAARWYNPASATFQSRDTYNGTTKNPISLNRYTYGHSGYINATDPTGHAPGDIAGILQLPWEDGSCSAGFYTGGFLGLCQQDTGRYASDCTANAMIIDLNGTCIRPWATGDACGTNGTRGYDVNMCIERQASGTACNWNGADGTIADDQITCAPKPPSASGGAYDNGTADAIDIAYAVASNEVPFDCPAAHDATGDPQCRAACNMFGFNGWDPWSRSCKVLPAGQLTTGGPLRGCESSDTEFLGMCLRQVCADVADLALECTQTRVECEAYSGPHDLANLVYVQGIRIHECVSGRLGQMLGDFWDEMGFDLGVSSSYRTYDQQIRSRTSNCGQSNFAVYDMDSESCGTPTARPGTSNHEDGLAIDLKELPKTLGELPASGRKRDIYNWMVTNASRYHFCQLPTELWHWSYDCR